jgi:sugar phosphate isomerase/epimerase
MSVAANGHRPAAGLPARRQQLEARLGLNVPAAWWPTPPLLKSIEAGGFSWVQVHAPPPAVLRDGGSAGHAAALRRALDHGSLRLVLHAPDDLRAGEPDTDQALDGLLGYAAAAGAEYVVYHGANFVVADGGDGAARVRDRLEREEASLRSRASRLEQLGITLAVENLAPVWPGPTRFSRSPAFVCELVRRVGSRRVRMLLDVGHAHITGDLGAENPSPALAPLLRDVALFHLHDNLGARQDGVDAPALDPLRLDLHLPPGAGGLPWDAVAPSLLAHPAPLVLEVHPPHRPDPIALAAVTTGLLRRRPGVSAARATTARPRADAPVVPLG